MRAQFEKMPEIATSLSQHIYFGDDNLYHSDLINFQKLVCWINGAWFTYQGQQKKIDTLKAKVQELWTELDDRQSKEHIIERCESIIQELLKE